MPPEPRRQAKLDAGDVPLRQLLTEAAALAEAEIRAARDGRVFDRPPELDRVQEAVGRGEPLPRDGEPVDDVLARCRRALGAGRRTAPGFFGYVLSPSVPVAVAADLLVSAADQNVTSWRSGPAATEIELQTVEWLGRFVGFSDSASGLFVSGGSLANLTALLTACRARAPAGADRRRLCVYAGDQAHFSVAKAADVLGVRLTQVAADDEFRLDPGALRAAIAADRAEGLQPFCVVASAGTTATGAVDPLGEIADVAAAEGLWLHVDGAYGAPAAAAPNAAGKFTGLDRADSLCVDAHKWLYVPVDCGVLLFRDAAAAAGTFGAADDYVRVLADGDESFAFWDHGIELSRRWRALKLWMTFRHYGADRLAEAIAEDIELAAYMAELVRAGDDLELLCEPSLSICCFRHTPAGMAEETLSEHNEQLLGRLQRDGRVYLSNVTIGGEFGLRACITNFRTTHADVDQALEVVRELAG